MAEKVTKKIELSAVLSPSYADSFKAAAELAKQTGVQLKSLSKEESELGKLQALSRERSKAKGREAERLAKQYETLQAKLGLAGKGASELSDRLEQIRKEKVGLQGMRKEALGQLEYRKVADELKRLQNASKGVAGSNPEILKAFEKTKKRAEELGISLGKKTGGSLKALKDGIMQAPSPVGQLARSLSSLKAGLMGPAGLVAGIIGLGIAAVGAAKKIGELGLATIAMGDEIAKQSRALGLSAQAYQELSYAMQRGGASEQAFSSGLKTLSKHLEDARSGSKSSIELFKRLGVSSKELKTMNLEEVFVRASEGLYKLGDASLVAKTSSQLFGGEGHRLASAMSVGANELENLRKQAQKTGFVLNDEVLAKAEEGADRLLDAQLRLKSIGQQIGAKVIPEMVEILRELVDLFDENKEAIEGFANFCKGFFKGAVAVAVGSIKGLLIGIKSVGYGLEWWRDLAKNSITSVSRTITNLSNSISNMWASALTWGRGVIDSISSAFDDAVVYVANLKDSVLEFLTTTIPKALDEAWLKVRAWGDAFWDWLSAIPSRLNDWASGLIDSLIDTLLDGLNGFARDLGKLPLVGSLFASDESKTSASARAMEEFQRSITNTLSITNNIDARGASPGAGVNVERAMSAASKATAQQINGSVAYSSLIQVGA